MVDLFKIKITKIHGFMAINWKVWGSLGVIVIIALVVIGFSQFGTKTPQAPISQEALEIPEASQTPVGLGGEQEQPVVIKPATGNVDDAVEGILSGIADDQALFVDAEKDAALITSDSQAISDFGQSYDANEF